MSAPGVAAAGCRPLAGIRVLEAASGLAARHATRLLADLGAEVRRLAIERTSTHDELPRALEEWLDHGKEIVRAPVRAEILVTDRDVDTQQVFAVVLRVSSFDRAGPWATVPACDLTLQHASGLAWHQAAPVANPATQPPRTSAEREAILAAGVGIAVAALWGLLAHQGGPAKRVEFSIHGFIAQLLVEQVVQADQPEGRMRLRAPGQSITIAGGQVWLLPCDDGFAMISPREDHQWNRWVEVMGEPAWASDAVMCGSRQMRMRHSAELGELMAQWSRPRTRKQVFDAAQTGRVACFPVNGAADLLDNEQLDYRGFFDRLRLEQGDVVAVPGLPFLLREASGTELAKGRSLPQASTPAQGEWSAASNAAQGALAGVRILDFSWVMAGPLCTKLLGAMGAEVIKVESGSRPEFVARGGWFSVLNNSKRSCTLDLSTVQGRELAARLAGRCDVVVENFSAGVMKRHGLDYDALSASHPSLIYASASGVGRTGPQSSALAYGTLLQAYSGRSALVGEPNAALEAMGVLPAWTDPATAWWEVLAIVTALIQRRRTGLGCAIDLSMLECTVALLPESLLAAQGACAVPAGMNQESGASPCGCFPCAGDDAWLALSVRTDAEWRALCKALGLASLARDPGWATAESRVAGKQLLDGVVAAALRTLNASHVEQALLSAGVPAARTLRMVDVLEQDAVPGLFPRMPDGTRTIAMPWTDEAGWRGSITPSPALGEHNAEVMGELLGITASDLEALVRAGVTQ